MGDGAPWDLHALSALHRGRALDATASKQVGTCGRFDHDLPFAGPEATNSTSTQRRGVWFVFVVVGLNKIFSHGMPFEIIHAHDAPHVGVPLKDNAK